MSSYSYTVDRKFLEELLACIEDGYVFGSERALMAGRIQAVLNAPSGPNDEVSVPLEWLQVVAEKGRAAWPFLSREERETFDRVRLLLPSPPATSSRT